MPWPAVLAAAAPYAAAAIGAFSARQQRRQADEFSRTSYQRTVDDLRKAGLNPALAYGQGAVRGQVPSIPDVGATFERAVSSARRLPLEKARTASEVELNDAMAKKARADAETSSAQRQFLDVQRMREGERLERERVIAIPWRSAKEAWQKYGIGSRAHDEALGQLRNFFSAAQIERSRQVIRRQLEGGEFR